MNTYKKTELYSKELKQKKEWIVKYYVKTYIKPDGGLEISKEIYDKMISDGWGFLGNFKY